MLSLNVLEFSLGSLMFPEATRNRIAQMYFSSKNNYLSTLSNPLYGRLKLNISNNIDKFNHQIYLQKVYDIASHFKAYESGFRLRRRRPS